MHATTRTTLRIAHHCRSRQRACSVSLSVHLRTILGRPLQRACQCQAGDDQTGRSASEDDSARTQDSWIPAEGDTNDKVEKESSGSAALREASEAASRAEFIAKYFQSSYDPMYHGKWVDIQGAEMKMPDYDFSEDDWMSRVPTDIGWPLFWEHFEDLTETDDEYEPEVETYTASGRLALSSGIKRARAFEAQAVLAGSPDFIAAGMEGTVKDEVPPATIIDRDRRDAEDPWELRARREKQEFRKERDYHWQVMQAMGHWQMLNHPPEDQTDVRIMEKVRAERYDWTDDQIWSIITNEGRSVDPFVMLNAPTFQTLNPLCMPDWAGQGIEYVDDMEDWVSQEGRWMSQAEYANVEALYRDIEDDEDIMEVEDSDDEDPLYEVSDVEGGDVGIEDEGEVSVSPNEFTQPDDQDPLSFA